MKSHKTKGPANSKSSPARSFFPPANEHATQKSSSTTQSFFESASNRNSSESVSEIQSKQAEEDREQEVIDAGAEGEVQRQPAFECNEEQGAESSIQRQASSVDTFANATSFFPDIQAKLSIGKTDDPLEKEADDAADQIVNRMQDSSSISPTQPESVEEEIQKEPLTSRLTSASQNHSTDNASPPTGFENRLSSREGNGRAMDEPYQTEMASGFGADFSDVRVHDDAQAADLSQSINARAFTHGHDIYFNQGEYQPNTTEGRRLLAHELAHTVQQGAVNRAVYRKGIQRADGDVPTTAGSTSTTGLVDNSTMTITYEKIQIPEFKGMDHRAALYGNARLIRSRNFNSQTRPNNQREIWRNNVSKKIIETKLKDKADSAEFVPVNGQYIFKSPASTTRSGKARRQKHFYIGTLDAIAESVSAPSWNRQGRVTARMETDHIVELQISGFPDSRSAHGIDNFELLNRNANQLSGNRIRRDIDSNVKKAIREGGPTWPLLNEKIPGLSKANKGKRLSMVKNAYDLVFQGYDAAGGPTVDEDGFWSRTTIENGEHLGPVEPASFSEIGEEGKALVFPTESGGVGKQFIWDGQKTDVTRKDEREWFKPWVVKAKRFSTGAERGQLELWFGEFDLEIPENSKAFKPAKQTIQVQRVPGTTLAGRISKQQIRRSVERLEVKGASPITVEEAGLVGGKGLVVQGDVLPTIPLISDARLRYRIEDGDLSVYRTFRADDFSFPGPINVDESSLTISISTQRGLQLEGRTNLSIDGVGQGYLEGAVSGDGQFAVEGGFDFDSNLFDPARIKVAYRNGQFSLSGELGIPAGKVQGIKSAKINVGFAENILSASGEAELDVPGVQNGNLNATYNNENGAFSVGGKFQLRNDIPGIRSGSVEASVSCENEQEGYQVRIAGEAQPDIPGLDTKLSIDYENGALTIAGRAAYSRGMLAGEVNIGASNRALGADGQPSGEPTDSFSVYGGGELELTLTPWLKATAGVQFLPNGELQVKGEIGLPSEVDVFDRIAIPENELFGLGFDIPIFAIPVGPKSIGLKATIRGGLRAHAGIGPGKLTNTRLGIEYNPARESETKLYGSAQFVVPADAGLKFFARATIGINALIGGVEGGLELSAGVGLDAQASAGVNVDWTPATGLELRANLCARVQPKLAFDIDGVIEAWFAWYDKEWRWSLASYEYGPDMRFGIKLPIEYKEGEPFNISFDDVVFERPNIDANFLKGLIRDIKNSRS